MTVASVTLHATCVAVAGRGVLITGPSGSGKSSLALQLMATGAVLVSDDKTVLRRDGDTLIATPPATISGMIEARGVGILSVPHLDTVSVMLVVDMATLERARLPERHSTTLLDIKLPCLHKVDAPYFPAAIHTYLMGTRRETS